MQAHTGTYVHHGNDFPVIYGLIHIKKRLEETFHCLRVPKSCREFIHEGVHVPIILRDECEKFLPLMAIPRLVWHITNEALRWLGA